MSYFYLASPYTLYVDGLDAAFRVACRAAGRFVRAGIPVYSPIAHFHPIAGACRIDPLDQQLWLSMGLPMMHAACGLIVCAADGWRDSKGIAFEIDIFERAGKPIVHVAPDEPLQPGLVARLRGIVEQSAG